MTMEVNTVIAINCVPEYVDKTICNFWRIVAKKMDEEGYVLILLSTTEINIPGLKVVPLPYLMTDFLRVKISKRNKKIDKAEISDVMQWYGCSCRIAYKSLSAAYDYFSDVLEAFRPSSVIGWQSMNPVMRVLRNEAQVRDIPLWFGERGWVRHSLMFDVCENNYLSEINRSFTIDRVLRKYVPAPRTIEYLRNKSNGEHDLSRYDAARDISKEELKEKYGISEEKKIVTIFTHGEPHLNTLYRSAIRDAHDISSEKMQSRVMEVAASFVRKGFCVLVQEHPFNEINNKKIDISFSDDVIEVKENVASLLSASDCFLFTLTTIQFDAIFFGKPFGLLSKSPLYHDGVPPFIGDFDSVDSFVDTIISGRNWGTIKEALEKYAAFLYENFLLDIEEDKISESADIFVSHLTRFSRPVDGNLDDRLMEFSEKWLS
ncbi:hypothetical protein ACMAUO_14055 [Gluconacetobacter sp. Hr-1-5]|uniref:hypothetical protein n=1 Tax=Gluconacetobacter sp. Hr-1-5 TaxID=3395370 RepID=UPI003B5275F9